MLASSMKNLVFNTQSMVYFFMSEIFKPITSKQITTAILAYIAVNIVAGYGIIFLGADISGIYAALNKPYFAPPTWVFGVA
jgi:hypothetical protein